MVAKIFGAIFFLSLLGIVLVLFQAGATSAGQTVFTQDYRAPGSNEALTFSNPATLKVFQASLQPGRPDYYAFQGAKDTVVQVKLDTLRLVGQDNFAPSLALFGPGLPPATPDELQLFPFSLPAGDGLLVSAESAPISPTGQVPPVPTRFDEAWTQAGYWERQSLLNQLPQDGTYYLAVYNLNQQSGKYALFVGDKPEAGLRETLTFPVTWARLHYWFDDLWWPTLALAGVGLAIIFLLYSFGRKLWRGYYRPLVFASRNERRAALLTKNKRHAWNKRRLNRAPTHKPLSSNVIVSRLLNQTAGRANSALAPATGPELNLQNGTAPEALPVSGGGSSPTWEDQGKTLISPAQIQTDMNSNVTVPAREDGLSQWGKRFRP